MKTNKAVKKEPVYSYEGGKASRITVLEELKRTTMACLLWEDEFYEHGISIANRIKALVKECLDNGYYDAVIDNLKRVKQDMKLRHCPLWMIVAIYKAGKTVDKGLISTIITRPDDAGELIAFYRKDQPDAPLPNAFKKGIAMALEKFDEYQLAKWNRNANYKLVDIVNLCHPKVTTAIDKLVKGTLETPMTWEVLLSKAGNDADKKREAWVELIKTNKLGAMAFLKNIRGMLNANVDTSLVKEYINNIRTEKLLPIDFIRAGQNNKMIENEIEQKFLQTFSKDKVKGKTAILVDVSGSMEGKRLDYANALAMIARETFESIDVYSFSEMLKEIPNRRGFALADVITVSQPHHGTWLWRSVKEVQDKGYDRIIVITDEQAFDDPLNASNDKSYIINVGSYENGVGYEYGYTHISGFSDKVFEYINECEKFEK